MPRARKKVAEEAFEPAGNAALAPGDLVVQAAMAGTEASLPQGEGRLVEHLPDNAIVEVAGMGLFVNGSRQQFIPPVEANDEGAQVPEEEAV